MRVRLCRDQAATGIMIVTLEVIDTNLKHLNERSSIYWKKGHTSHTQDKVDPRSTDQEAISSFHPKQKTIPLKQHRGPLEDRPQV